MFSKNKMCPTSSDETAFLAQPTSKSDVGVAVIPVCKFNNKGVLSCWHLFSCRVLKCRLKKSVAACLLVEGKHDLSRHQRKGKSTWPEAHDVLILEIIGEEMRPFERGG